jgi:hypothetical protein
MSVVLGQHYKEVLGIEEEALNKRVQRLEGLDEQISKCAEALADGWCMTEGLIFSSGRELGYLVANAVKVSLAIMMENGHLAKTLPKQKPEPEEKSKKGYL